MKFLSSKKLWRKHHKILPEVRFDGEKIYFDNLFCKSDFTGCVFNLSDLERVSILMYDFKVLGIKAVHLAWLLEFSSGAKIVISPEARKPKGHKGHVRPIGGIFARYEFRFFIYCLEDFEKRKEVKTYKKDFELKPENFSSFLKALSFEVGKLNKKEKANKYNLIFNNCAMNMANTLSSALDGKKVLFSPYFWSTGHFDKLAKKIINEKA